jgi:predicted amidophosphoribosyltransferase
MEGARYRDAAAALRNALEGTSLEAITWVPVPPSKIKGDPNHDDRMLRILAQIGSNLDIRELVVLSANMVAAHESETRLRPDELAKSYSVDETLCAPPPSFIAICDDMLTTGCHYRAIQSLLAARFPAARFCGIFLARRAPQPPAFEVVDPEA